MSGARYMTTPAGDISAGVHVLAGSDSEAAYRRDIAAKFEARFRGQVANRVGPHILDASVRAIRDTVMRNGVAAGAGVAIATARRLGVSLR
jgi:hypothetical protein